MVSMTRASSGTKTGVGAGDTRQSFRREDINHEIGVSIQNHPENGKECGTKLHLQQETCISTEQSVH